MAANAWEHHSQNSTHLEAYITYTHFTAPPAVCIPSLKMLHTQQERSEINTEAQAF